MAWPDYFAGYSILSAITLLQIISLVIIFFNRTSAAFGFKLHWSIFFGGFWNVVYIALILSVQLKIWPFLQFIQHRHVGYWVSFVSPALILLPHSLRSWGLYKIYSKNVSRIQGKRFERSFECAGIPIVATAVCCAGAGTLNCFYLIKQGRSCMSRKISELTLFPEASGFAFTLIPFWLFYCIIFCKLLQIRKLTNILENLLVTGGYVLTLAFIISMILNITYDSRGHFLPPYSIDWIFLTLCSWSQGISLASQLFKLWRWKFSRKGSPRRGVHPADIIERSHKSRSCKNSIRRQPLQSSKSMFRIFQKPSCSHILDDGNEKSISMKSRSYSYSCLPTPGEERTGPVSRDLCDEWSLQNILVNPLVLEQFKKFLGKSFCEELVNFLLDVHDYEVKWQGIADDVESGITNDRESEAETLRDTKKQKASRKSMSLNHFSSMGEQAILSMEHSEDSAKIGLVRMSSSVKSVLTIAILKSSKSSRALEVEDQLKNAKDICSTYILPGSPQEVNISYDLKQPVIDKISDPKAFRCSSSLERQLLFKDVKQEVLKVLNQNSLNDFHRSKEFLAAVRKGLASTRSTATMNGKNFMEHKRIKSLNRLASESSLDKDIIVHDFQPTIFPYNSRRNTAKVKPESTA